MPSIGELINHTGSFIKYYGILLRELLVTTFDSPIIKVLFGFIIAVASFLFDAVIYQAGMALIALIVMEAFTGTYVAYQKKSGPISSKMFKAAAKVLLYSTMISAGFQVEKATVLIDFVDETTVGFLALTELISIFENISKAGYATPKSLIDKITNLKEKI